MSLLSEDPSIPSREDVFIAALGSLMRHLSSYQDVLTLYKTSRGIRRALKSLRFHVRDVPSMPLKKLMKLLPELKGIHADNMTHLIGPYSGVTHLEAIYPIESVSRSRLPAFNRAFPNLESLKLRTLRLEKFKKLPVFSFVKEVCIGHISSSMKLPWKHLTLSNYFPVLQRLRLKNIWPDLLIEYEDLDVLHLEHQRGSQSDVVINLGRGEWVYLNSHYGSLTANTVGVLELCSGVRHQVSVKEVDVLHLRGGPYHEIDAVRPFERLDLCCIERTNGDFPV